ncbi:geranylgeranyl pyrophosphate synthase isoform X2 [Ooceraea biroi]|uniref:Geranylgeranyl pyrophosphate synthase n=1 Tax=Ooceraea biroi TaxID=2015173 RepID=A0A026WFX6_OOCBI|nr:geranylgeranyl pyrophosphate synthase isoform X2 [Ooceraea biroi]EZA54566.1 Geranylgeranyl pyrophosphate synthase [Ooceraea biroi]
MTSVNNINVFYPLDGASEEDKKILEPIEYILQSPIVQITNNLILAFNYWLKIPKDKAQEIIEITHMLYIADVILDDIQDNSDKRYGIAAAHSVYGIARTTSAAHCTLFSALKRMANLQHFEALKICIEMVLDAFKGQGIEIVWRDNFTCPSEEAYKNMIEKKISTFFHMCVKVMQQFSTCDKDFSSLTRTLGLYFQIRDDYCNLRSSDYTEEKGYSDDLTEGKFSLAIIHALHSKPEDNEIKNILRKRTKNIEMKRHCNKLLEECGSFEYTRKVLEELNAKARAEIDRLGGNPLLIKILDDSDQLGHKNTLLL